MKLRHASKFPKSDPTRLFLVLVSDNNLPEAEHLLENSFALQINLGKQHAEKSNWTLRFSGDQNIALLGLGQHSDEREGIRRAVANAVTFANDHKFKSLVVSVPTGTQHSSGDVSEAIAETLYLANYQFLTYKSKKDRNSLAEATVVSPAKADEARVERALKVARAVEVARDLVNEPVITLTAKALADRAEELGKEYGFKVEVFNKKQIQSLKMGGLLAVNTGSVDPPTFTVMEWKPKKANNSKPVVLVGKGVVYDTGGLSLKPTLNSMDSMKSDMAGAAAVICTMCTVAALNLPVHVVGLVPATDNRPGGNAYTPGDVITMFDGSTVEVLNTDAEGRMILADALAYAKKYDPQLVIDLATLTGAQIVAIGYQAAALMGTASPEVKASLAAAGQRMYERTAELPLWDEYKELLKSDIADMKNIGGSSAGSITAAKFLEQFTAYPWIHLDIAGPSWLGASDAYRPRNGTGYGVRLLTEFLSSQFGDK
jgi:leucyl aminopeptidase